MIKVLAIIPARGGSKGVPGKNIALLDDKPLLTYAMETVANSNKISRVVVSTDDEGIANIAKSAHAIIIDRPAHLATDEAPIVPVIMHAIETCQTVYGEQYDAVILLQPTAPLRTGTDVDHAIELLEKNPETDGVISVIKLSDIHPARMYRVDEFNHDLIALDPEGETARRQDLPPVYIRNGCIYAVRINALYEQNTVMPQKKSAYVMDEQWWLNIDNPRDLLLGNIIAKAWNQQKNSTLL